MPTTTESSSHPVIFIHQIQIFSQFLVCILFGSTIFWWQKCFWQKIQSDFVINSKFLHGTMMFKTSGGIEFSGGGGGGSSGDGDQYFNNDTIFQQTDLNRTIIADGENANSNPDTINQLQTYSKILTVAEIFTDYTLFYYTPILVFTGSLGNILSVIVFFKTKLRKLSSSVYLSALAISDTFFLLLVFAQWLNFIDINWYNLEFVCQFFTFFSTWCSFCSVWFVVAFTVERFIAVMYPLKRQSVCTVKRAKSVLVGLIGFGCIHGIPYLFVASPIYDAKLNATICDTRIEYKDYSTFINYIDTVVVFAVPSTTIIILNTFTGCIVWKFATVRRSLTIQKRQSQTAKSQFSSTHRASILKRQNSSVMLSSDCAHSNGQNSQSFVSLHSHEIKSKQGRRQINSPSQIKVTKMLLVVSTVFVCLNLPSYVLRIKAYLETNTSKSSLLSQYIAQFLFTTNFGINFILYCVSGQNFRKALVNLFRSMSKSQREGTIQITVSDNFRSSGGTFSRKRFTSQKYWQEKQEMVERFN